MTVWAPSTPLSPAIALSAGAIEQLEEERFAEGERTMSEAERADLYEPDSYVAKEPIERQRLADQLTAIVAAT